MTMTSLFTDMAANISFLKRKEAPNVFISVLVSLGQSGKKAFVGSRCPDLSNKIMKYHMYHCKFIKKIIRYFFRYLLH